MRLPPDPTFDEIKKAGGIAEPHDEPHTVSNDHVWVSGEIERTAEWESGILFGIRWVDNKWEPDEVGLCRAAWLAKAAHA